MRVRVTAWAGLREVCGDGVFDLELTEGATARELWDAACVRYPALLPWEGCVRIASGVEWMEWTTLVELGAEVSLMPPVQGG